MTTKKRKEILAGILKDPERRSKLAEQLASQIGAETKAGGLGLLRTMSKEYPSEVQEVLDTIESMPEPAPVAKKGGKKKGSGKKKGGKKGNVKKAAKKTGAKKGGKKKTAKKKPKKR